MENEKFNTNEFAALTDMLLKMNVNGLTEEKNGLTYLSWAHAWKEVLKVDPLATYGVKFFKQADGTELPYFGNEKMGYMVFTFVTIKGFTRECYLPVMDYKNNSVLQPKTTDINKALMRCMAKNVAMFGLGIYIYAGQDLPEEDESAKKEVTPKAEKKAEPKAEKKAKPTKPAEPATQEQVNKMVELGINIGGVLGYYGVPDLHYLSKAQAQEAIDLKVKALERKGDAQ